MTIRPLTPICSCGRTYPVCAADLCADAAVFADRPSLLDITPVAPRNPFAPGALLPMSVDTASGSTYEITEHALRVDSPATCTVSCTRGSRAGMSWTAEVTSVVLTRAFLYMATLDGTEMTTNTPVAVNGYPVATWEIPTLYGTCGKCHMTCTRVFLPSREAVDGFCAECIATL